jgi:flavin reductase (DIM6/NTAB) family NADH-FMN oxidoreductase RutF
VSQIDVSDFIEAMAHFPSGVTVVTTRDASGKGVGFTASAFTSVSLAPPLILVCLQNDADSYPAFMAAEAFAVSILSVGQHDVATHFARKHPDKLSTVSTHEGSATGIPLISGACAYIECTMHERLDGGDHKILVGEVLTASSDDRAPLAFMNRQFGRFQPELPYEKLG